VESELGIGMNNAHFFDFTTLRDVHNYICNELGIAIERKTIRQKKAEQRKAAEEWEKKEGKNKSAT
jgi:hypothetical protein